MTIPYVLLTRVQTNFLYVYMRFTNKTTITNIYTTVKGKLVRWVVYFPFVLENNLNS